MRTTLMLLLLAMACAVDGKLSAKARELAKGSKATKQLADVRNPDRYASGVLPNLARRPGDPAPRCLCRGDPTRQRLSSEASRLTGAAGDTRW